MPVCRQLYLGKDICADMSSTRTICLVFCAVSLTIASEGARDDFLEPSISAAVRVGATIASRFLNPEPRALFPVLFYKLTEGINKHSEVNEGKEKRRKNDFIMVMLKLLGVDSSKITDFAFNGIISLVLLMNQILLKDTGGRRRKQREASRDLSLFSFILRQQQIVEQLEQMQDPKLVDLILTETKKKLKSYPEKDLECTELLICKMKPFVRGMQRSLRFFLKREKRKTSGGALCEKEIHEETCREDYEYAAWEKANLEGRMYFFLPDTKEVAEWGDQCDRLFQNCIY